MALPTRLMRDVKTAVIIVLALTCCFLLLQKTTTRDQAIQPGAQSDLDVATFRLKALNARGQQLHRALVSIQSAVNEQRQAVAGTGEVKQLPRLKAVDSESDLVEPAANKGADARAVAKPDSVHALAPGIVVQYHEDRPANGGGGANLDHPESKVVDTIVGLEHVPSLNHLNPAKKISQARSGVSLVIGIPTIHRPKQSYLIGTIQSLITNLIGFDKGDVLFVVMVGDLEKANVDAVFAEVESHYAAELQSGMIDVISPSPKLYPDIAGAVPSFKDPKDRFYWRTKQVFDFAYLMMYARSRGLYYLQVEDDIQAMPNYAMHIVERAKKDTSWEVLEFSSLGFIGKLFRSADLTGFAHFFFANAFYKPVDWLLDDWFYVHYCSPEKDMKDCKLRKKEHRVLFKPSLFQHLGHFSSLEGKIQKLRDRSFQQKNLPALHNNPAAVISTSLKNFQQNTIESAYLQTGFFWGMAQTAGDRITFTFSSSVQIKSVIIASGSADHPGDKFPAETKLQYLANDENNRDPTKENWHDLCSPDTKQSFTCQVPPSTPALRAISILFGIESKQWVVIPAILFHPA